MNTETIFKLGDVCQLPFDRGLLVMVNGRELAIFRQRNGEVFAVENKASSGEDTYQGRLEDGYLIAPESGQRYSMKSGDGVDTHDYVTIFPSWIEKGEIFVKYPTLIFGYRSIYAMMN